MPTATAPACVLHELLGLAPAFGLSGARVSMFLACGAKLSEYTVAIGLAALDALPGLRLRPLRLQALPAALFRASTTTPGVRSWGSSCGLAAPGA
jgi:hypothetical protein